MNELKAMSYDLRRDVVDMIISGKGGHIGGDMSMMDIRPHQSGPRSDRRAWPQR